MTYHALQPPASDGAPPTWAVGAAFSESGPLGPWVKSGRVLSGGDEGAWDCRGIGTRHVVRSPRDPSEMVSEDGCARASVRALVRACERVRVCACE